MGHYSVTHFVRQIQTWFWLSIQFSKPIDDPKAMHFMLKSNRGANSTYLSGSVSGASAPSANAMYEVLGRLEQLQGEIQQLRGVVEEQAHMILDLKKRQNNIYSDLDLRLQELVGVDVSQMPNKEANGNNLDKVQSLGKTSIPVRSKSKVVAVNPRSSARNEKEL